MVGMPEAVGAGDSGEASVMGVAGPAHATRTADSAPASSESLIFPANTTAPQSTIRLKDYAGRKRATIAGLVEISSRRPAVDRSPGRLHLPKLWAARRLWSIHECRGNRECA